jgi:UDP-N-acetylmuramyl tripeptide synthase
MDRTRLPLRTTIAALLGGLAGLLSRLLGRGSGGTIPGRITLALAPQALAQLTAGRRVLLVSGTNGKTTTTSYLAAALRSAGPVVTNEGGSNLARGLATAMLLSRRDTTSPVVLEVDEVVLPYAIAQTRPVAVVLLNLSRDQLDRLGEVASHVSRWSQALSTHQGVVVVANADDPLVVDAVHTARPDGHGVVFVGAGGSWRQDASLCPRCGAPLPLDRLYQCPRCDFARPATGWAVEDDLLIRPDGAPVPLELGLPGRANRGNAAQAAAAAVQVGIDPVDAVAQMRAVTEVSGRYLVVKVDGTEAQLLLAKNPAGWAEALDLVASRTTPVVLAINARTADGTDPSWLWDVPFELLQGRQVAITGERVWDLAVRLDHAEVPYDVADDVAGGIRRVGGARCDVVANYTAFTTARAALLRGDLAVTEGTR